MYIYVYQSKFTQKHIQNWYMCIKVNLLKNTFKTDLKIGCGHQKHNKKDAVPNLWHKTEVTPSWVIHF